MALKLADKRKKSVLQKILKNIGIPPLTPFQPAFRVTEKKNLG